MTGKGREPGQGQAPRPVPQPLAGDAARTLFQQALAHHQGGELAAAETLYGKVLAQDPRHFDALHLSGVIFAQRRQLGLAVARMDEALAVDPGSAVAWSNRGAALLDLGRWGEAVESLDRALALKPQAPQALCNRGLALRHLERHEEAMGSFQGALGLNPRQPDALNGLAGSLVALRRHSEAAVVYAALVALAPDYPYAVGRLHQARMLVCDWSGFGERVTALGAALRDGKRSALPLWHLAVSADAAVQRRCAEICAADQFPPARDAVWTGQPYGHDRIRLAYVSADFRNHAVANHMAGVFEGHDRSRFHVVGVSLRAADSSPLGRRVHAAFDETLDASTLSDLQVARLLREREIDVAVDLMGYTTGCRLGIFAHRPAPVQITYLGYPGTTGAPYMDYLVADDHVVPRHRRGAYSERIIQLPDCFQANDRARFSPGPPPARRKLGLPDTGVVFCAFNNTYKLNPVVFAVWMRLLQAAPGSVLWLLADDPQAAANLAASASAHEVDPDRLIYAQRIPYEDHLTRLQAADLFLDTLPFTAGATASDALWAGVPLVTCGGDAFAARMAGSLLRVLGVPELIAPGLDDYESLALDLARNPERRMSLRARIAAGREHSSLFDTARFCRHLENGYEAAWQRAEQRLAPQDIEVLRLPG